eukprot:PRCOL_00001599-RA
MFGFAAPAARSARGFATVAGAAARQLEEAYAAPLQHVHWLMAGGTLAAFGLVQAAQRSEGKTKGTLMYYHKSVGLALGMLAVPRLALRLTTKIPPHHAGLHKVETLAADGGHLLLYGMLTAMPATGVAMGYFGGKGLPFFATTLPAAKEPNGAIAKQAFSIHRTVGQAFEIMVPLHVGAVAQHHMRGQYVMNRMTSVFK